MNVRHKRWLAFLSVWLVATAAATYIRLYPLWGHIWSATSEQATMAVILNIKQTLLTQIRTLYPSLPPAQADLLASAKLNETLHKDNARVRQAIERVNGLMSRERGTKNDPIYLLESDPFNFYNLAENIQTKGRMAEVIKGNKYFNPLMVAPFGFWQPLTIHPYAGFLLYKLGTLFNPGLPLMTAVAFTPLVLTALALLAFLWCGRIAGLGFPALLAGSFPFAMAPIFLKRSALGWFDTDPYNLIFPFLLLGILFNALTKSTLVSAAKHGVLLALVLLLYSLIWQGWVFLFFMTFLCAGSAAAFSFAAGRAQSRSAILLVFSAAAGVSVIIAGCGLYGWNDFWSFFTEGAGELKKFTVKGMNLWPNLFLEVGELRKSTAADLSGDTGGPFFLAAALAGLGVAAVRAARDLRSPATLRTVALAVFLTVTLVMTLKAERFALFTLVPLSLFFAMGTDWLLHRLQPRPWGKTMAAAAVLAILASSWSGAQASIRTVLTPIYNHVWDDALTALRRLSPEDSIINTWWPPGHFIKAVAHRRVPFDGASLSESATGYWMANVLLSTDERTAAGILRMLNSSGNQAVDFLTARGLPTSNAVGLIKLIAALPPGQAREMLLPFLSAADAQQAVLLTHGGRPHSYLLIYNEMIDTNAGLVFVGRRNFQKIEAINADPKLLAAVPQPDTTAFIDFLWGISGGPAKFSEPLSLMGEDADTMYFNEGLSVKKDKSAATIRSARFGQGSPAGIVYSGAGRVMEKDFPGPALNYRIVLYTQEGKPVCRLMDKDMADSLLVRLFFYDGKGLDHFRLAHTSADLTGRTQIKIFEVVW